MNAGFIRSEILALAPPLDYRGPTEFALRRLIVKIAHPFKQLKTAWLAAMFAVGIATQASAAEVYTVDPSVLGGPAATFEANFLLGNSSSLLTLNAGPETIDGAGWINFNGFTLNNIAVAPLDSGLGVDYQLWATCEYTTSLENGTFGAAGSDYVVTALTFDLFGTPGLTSAFTAADASDATAATVVAGAGTQLIGSGAS